MGTNDRMIDLSARVLLVEDDPAHAFIAVTVIRQVLGDGCEVVVGRNRRRSDGM